MKKSEYALVKAGKSGLLSYWTGKYTEKRKLPAMSPYEEHARTFSCASEAYWEGGKDQRLAYHRAFRLYYKYNEDGFITEWWNPEEEEE